MSDLILEARDELRASSLGLVRHLRVFAPGYRPLSWREVWECFAEAYPGRWAVQVFPPAKELIDGKAVYHLWLCETAPTGLNLRA